jgi:menaquinone-dependent protoporphyrinogen IX oxidase
MLQINNSNSDGRMDWFLLAGALKIWTLDFYDKLNINLITLKVIAACTTFESFSY